MIIAGTFAARADDASTTASTPTTNESTNAVGTGSTAVGTESTAAGVPILDLAQPQVVLHPRGAHSEKPAIFRTMIEGLCGRRSRIELFARTTAQGWDVWGAESAH